VKRIQVLTALIVLAALLLSACGGAAETQPTQAPADNTPAGEEPPAQEEEPTQPAAEEPASGEPVTLTLWYWGEQEAPGMQSFMEQAVSTWNTENPNVQVNAVLQETDSLYPAFRAAAEAGEGPDIQFFFGGVFTLEDAWLGNLAPISDYWTEEELNHIPAGQRAETFWDGKQWGVPFYQIGTFWAYNKQMFEQAGLDPENPPETWDEWMAACGTLREAGITPIGTGFKDGWLGGWMVSYLGQQNMNSIEDLMAAIRGERSLTEPMYAEWWSRWKEMMDNQCFNEDIMSLDLYQGQALFEQEQAAMTNHVEPYIAVLERNMGADVVGVMRTPVYGSGELAASVGIPTQTLAITSFSPNKEQAAEFLRFLHRDDIMQMMYDMAGAVTPDDRFQADWLNTNADRQIVEWRDQYPLFWYQYYYPPVWESEGAIALGQLLVTGEITPEEAAQQWQDLADKNRRENPEQIENYRKWELLPQAVGEQ
jgi:raffinose/stachyose/melibiose transport system substrate-binding protein